MWVQYLSSFSVSQETIRRVKQGVAPCAPCQSKKSLAWSVLCYCWLLIPDCSRGYRRGYWDRGARSFHQRMSDAGGVDRVWFLFYNRGEKNLRLDTYLSAYSCEISDVGKLLQEKKDISRGSFTSGIQKPEPVFQALFVSIDGQFLLVSFPPSLFICPSFHSSTYIYPSLTFP